MKIKSLLLSLALLGLFSCAKESLPAIGTDNDNSGNYTDATDIVPGWIRIKLAEETQPLHAGVFTRGAAESGNELIDNVAAQFGATEIRRVFSDGGKFAERRRKYGLHLWYDIKIDESVPVSRAGKAFAGIQGVESTEPIVQVKIDGDVITPDISEYRYGSAATQSRLSAAEASPFDDPELYKQWHYYNDGSLEGSVAGADINVFPAWRNITAGKPEVIVAIIDGGIQTDHPDLAANMWINTGEIPGNGIDDDNNGYIDDIYGWNVYTQSGEITQHRHGTHVAGTVAAVNNNGIGVCGVAGGTGNGDGVRLMSCQSYVTLPNGTSAGNVHPDLFAYAADNGAVIAQNSWGYTSKETPPSMTVAIRYFVENAGVDDNGNQTGPMKGGVVCFSAGNGGEPEVEAPSYLDEVIAVTAMDPNYKKSSYSSYGDKAGIFAPGGARVPASESATNPLQVYSTCVNGGYAYMHGTSMACPHVSGVAALIVSHYGVGKSGFTAEECKKILLSSYRPVGEYITEAYADKLGVGLLDASLILQEDPKTAPERPSDVKLTTDHDTVTAKFTLPADGNGSSVLRVNITYTRQDKPDESTKKVFINTSLPGQPFEKTFDLIGSITYNFSITVEDRYGNVSAPFEGTATPLPHINRPPTGTWIDNVLMQGTSPRDWKSIDLKDYFTDPDVEYGDYLTYTFEHSAPDYVTVSLDRSTLLFEPIYVGESNVTVTATDSHGLSVTKEFKAKILKGTQKPVTPPTDDKKTDITKAAVSIAPNPVEDTMNLVFTHVYNEKGHIVIYDGAGRKTLDMDVNVNGDGKSFVNVSTLAPGVYTAVCNVLGREFKMTLAKR